MPQNYIDDKSVKMVRYPGHYLDEHLPFRNAKFVTSSQYINWNGHKKVTSRRQTGGQYVWYILGIIYRQWLTKPASNLGYG